MVEVFLRLTFGTPFFAQNLCFLSVFGRRYTTSCYPSSALIWLFTGPPRSGLARGNLPFSIMSLTLFGGCHVFGPWSSLVAVAIYVLLICPKNQRFFFVPPQKKRFFF